MTTPRARRQSAYPYDDPDAQVAVFRPYERLGTTAAVAAELGMSEEAVRKRLRFLYERIGAVSPVHAGYLLREASG